MYPLRSRFALPFLLVTLACASSQKPVLEGEDEVLVTVEGEEITAYDLHRAVESTLGHLGEVALSGGSKRELLEGMALGKAVALLRERELDAAQKAELDKRVEVFRERVLVEQYLAAHAQRKPISEEELKAYYQENPHKFGARDIKAFDLVHAPLPAEDGARVHTLAALGKVREAVDFQRAVDEWQKTVTQLRLSQGDAELASLPAKLRALALRLSLGEASAVTILDGKGYVLRVTHVEAVPPRPFADVRDQIATLLAPRSDKAAVLSVREAVLKKVKVDYTDPRVTSRKSE